MYLVCILVLLGKFYDNYMTIRVSRLITCTYGILGIGGLIFTIVVFANNCMKSKRVCTKNAFTMILCLLVFFLIIEVHISWNDKFLGGVYNILNLDRLNFVEFLGFSTMCILLTVGVFNVIREMLITFLKIFSQDKNKD